MSIEWCRLWHDMPTDPKFRAVAKRAGRPTAEVLAIFTAMLANASANEDDRGTLRSWSHEDIAVALDIETEHAEAIFEAMQGKLIDGDRLTGWERRQPKREDNSAERVKAHRERKRTQANAPETERNAPETLCNAGVTQRNAPDKEEDKDSEEEIIISSASDAARDAADDPIKRMSNRLFGIAGHVMQCQSIAPGLAAMTIPLMWIEGGADFERDVVPAVTEVAARVATKGRKLSSWDYFTRPVSEHLARRKAGMPAVDLPKHGPAAQRPVWEIPTRKVSNRDAFEMNVEELRQLGLVA